VGSEGAARLSAALDGALRESIRRAGGDFQLMSGGLSRAAQMGVNDLATYIDGLDRLKAAGVETGETLALSIGKAIDAADSEKALDAVRVQIERVRAVLGEQIASGFLDQAAARADELRDRLDKALPSINSIREAYKQLGLQAPADLARIAEANRAAWRLMATDTSASTDVLAQGFARYGHSALAASGQVGSASRAMTEELLRTEAAAKGLAIEFDKTGRLIVQGSAEAAQAIDRTTRSIQRQTQALQDQQRVTSDGLKANVDGSAAGTFGNVVPTDVAYEIMRKRDRGELTADDLDDAKAAVQQARNAQDWLGSMSARSVSTEALQSTAALLRAAEDAVQRVTRMQTRSGSQSSSTTSAGGGYTVNVNLSGSTTSLGMATQGDADALAGLQQQLDQARGVAR
jgi:hypothetical protein